MSRKNKILSIENIKVSCKDCSLLELCLPHGLDGVELEQLDKQIKRRQPCQPGQHLFRAGDKSHALFAVRSGALKTYCTTEDGSEQVLGFTLPGELVGLDGISGNHYSSASVALETSSVCEIRFDQIEELCTALPGLHRQMMRVIGKEITADQKMLMLLGKRNAEERLASFLLSMSSRYRSRGLSATEFNLPMSRQDIGNYLGLAIETVSRLFAHFQDEKLLAAKRKQVTLLDLERLGTVVEGCQDVRSASV